MHSSRLSRRSGEDNVSGRSAFSRTPEGADVPFDVRWVEVVPGRLGCYVPTRPDDLLEEAVATPEAERAPYFVTVWPAGESLARAVLEGPDLAKATVLDLGSGVGVVGLAAALRGARVTWLDWEPRALVLADRSAARLGVPRPTSIVADWREPSSLGRFDRVLAADVLYDAADIAPVARFLARHLDPEGEAWVADPGRDRASRFPSALTEVGLVTRATPLPPAAHGVDVELHRVRHEETR